MKVCDLLSLLFLVKYSVVILTFYLIVTGLNQMIHKLYYILSVFKMLVLYGFIDTYLR